MQSKSHKLSRVDIVFLDIVVVELVVVVLVVLLAVVVVVAVVVVLVVPFCSGEVDCMLRLELQNKKE